MASKTTLQTFGLFIALAAIVFLAPFLWSLGEDPTAGLKAGEPMPALHGTAWLNRKPDWLEGKDPTAASLAGKVVIVHSWFPACPHCHTGAPTLVEVQAKYANRDDVVFIGLTHWTDEDGQPVTKFLKKYGITWPNAIGAMETLQAFKTEYFPGYWVFGRDGRATWNKGEGGINALDSAIEKTLAAPAP